MKSAINFFREILNNKRLIWDLAVRQFLSGTFGSSLGIAWLFIEPLFYVVIMYFFFTKALRFTPSGQAPYLPWLMSSMSVWYFFSSCLTASPNLFKTYSYLIKRWGFNMSILPVVSLLSMIFLHFIFLAILFVVFALHGVSFSIYWFQAAYYLFALCCLLLGLSWTLGSIGLFIQDVKNMTGIILQIGFWISPIFWDIETYPEAYRPYIRLNPLVYIMEGYRNSFLFQRSLFEHWEAALYFWSVTFVMLVIGFYSYKKLRPSFGDVIS